MKVLTAGNYKFKKLIESSIKKITDLGYDAIVYDLGGLNIGKKLLVKENDLIRTNEGKTPIACTFKPLMIRECLKELEHDETLLYLDGDALLLQRIDEMESNDYDIAVTVRKEAESYINHKYMGALNAGVIIFKKNNATMRFVDDWVSKANEENNDQTGLNVLLKKYIALDKIGQTIGKDNLKVKLLPCEIYNNYYSLDSEELKKVKIRHFKGGLKKL